MLYLTVSVVRQENLILLTSLGCILSPCTRTKGTEVVIPENYNPNDIQFADGYLQSGAGAQGQVGGQEGVWWPDKECLTSCKLLLLFSSSTSVIIKVLETINLTWWPVISISISINAARCSWALEKTTRKCCAHDCLVFASESSLSFSLVKRLDDSQHPSRNFINWSIDREWEIGFAQMSPPQRHGHPIYLAELPFLSVAKSWQLSKFANLLFYYPDDDTRLYLIYYIRFYYCTQLRQVYEFSGC